MNPQQNFSPVSEGVKPTHRLFQVTRTSKYLALVVFILLPFIGGLIGYVYAPVQTVYVYETKFRTAEAPVVSDKLSLCGKEFTLKNTQYVGGHDVAREVAKLLTAEYEAENKSDETSCYWMLEGAEEVTELEVKVRFVRYDYNPITEASSTEAFLVDFITTDDKFELGEGNLVDEKTFEVFRTNTMDGSKGKSLGFLGQ